jgi:hypothetical protein
MLKEGFLLIAFLVGSTVCTAQFSFEFSPDIPVKVGAKTLSLPWAGGLNYAQFSDIDVDFDGDLDLFVFDRSNDEIRVFTQELVNGQPKYVLDYGAKKKFPADIRYRATLVDYDGDGKKDLFCYGIGGIKVYRNVGSAASGLQWVTAKKLLYSDYWGNSSNLYVSSSDIPAIVDVEGDGDLDVLTYHIGGEHLQYHQNQSMELYGVPDSLVFILKNECWGGFREDLNTNSLFLNDNSLPCSTGNVPNPKSRVNEMDPKHSGSTILAIDMDHSGVLDLIIGDVSFPNLNLLMNGGSVPNSNSLMVSIDANFPSNSQSVNLQTFPAAFWVDVDFDGKKDLIVSGNARNISQNETGVLFYKNVGTNATPVFVFQTNAFLQQEMIEHGTGSIPVFFDYNSDGLEDLFVGNFHRYIPTLSKESGISYYKNTGTATQPVFTFIDNNFLNLTSLNLGLHLVPTFGDINNDGKKDLFIGLENGKLAYFQHTGVGGAMSFAAPVLNYTDDTGAIISVGQYASPQLFDLNKDGKLDLIIGQKTGELIYYENVGTPSSPSFKRMNALLGNVDVSSTNSPDGYPIPHFFRRGDTTYLFLGAIDGKLHYYDSVDNHLASGNSFHLVSPDFLQLDGGAYSAFSVNDIDNDGRLNLFMGQGLGGVYHFEHNPNSTIGVSELNHSLPVRIYPNPTRGLFTVDVGTMSAFSVTVRDAVGKEYVRQAVVGDDLKIDLTDAAEGVYLVEVEIGTRKTALRIVKM